MSTPYIFSPSHKLISSILLSYQTPILFFLFSFSVVGSVKPLRRGMEGKMVQGFEDFLPIMVEKLGGEGLMGELSNGFRLLMDPQTELITFESLKKNAEAMGLNGMSDEELRSMVREGDLDGDDALNQMEFCVLMIRLSPELMNCAWRLLEESLDFDGE